MKFRKKPVVIEALQLHAPFLSEIREHFPEVTIQANGTALIQTLEGTMLASEFDWIIRGVKGEVYPCKPDIFEATYEPADRSATEASDRERITSFLNDCSDSWGRQADQYEAVGDKEQTKACIQTSTAFAAAARIIEAGNE